MFNFSSLLAAAGRARRIQRVAVGLEAIAATYPARTLAVAQVLNLHFSLVSARLTRSWSVAAGLPARLRQSFPRLGQIQPLPRLRQQVGAEGHQNLAALLLEEPVAVVTMPT